MPMQPGQMLSHYRLIEKIGEGGMGVVWKAEDTTLRRPVAIKFLTTGGMSDRDRRARFLREARLAAALNHPSICAIHEVAEVQPGDLRELPTGESLAESTPYLVLEFVEGQPLDLVLRTTRGLPLDEILSIATQVAEGLAAAHEREIIHRDLKPGNIMLTPGERIKILDFGLAKHLWPADAIDAVLTQAETISEELTRAGMVVGTVAYMSPEQARGETLDSRSDIFSFGIMLYEVVSGQRPFRGETSESTRLKIIEADPDPLPESRTGVPPELERIVWRCLRKKPDERYHDTRDLALALKDLHEETPSGQARRIASQAVTVAGPLTRWTRILPWAFVVLLVPLVFVVGWVLRPTESPSPAPVTRFTVLLPKGERLASFFRPGFAVSPDGRTLVFVSGTVNNPFESHQSSRLYLRRFDQQEARPLGGTEGARWPVFSPDGRWVAFSVDTGELKKVQTVGLDPPVILCKCDASYGLDWGPDGTIAFASMRGALQVVSAAGGEPQALTHLDEESREVSHRLPHLLPGDEAVLYTSVRYRIATIDWQQRAGIFVESLRTGQRKLLIQGGTDARYATTGHLLFAREGREMAAPFDLDRLEVTGPEVPVVEGVSHAIYTAAGENDTAAAFLSLSPSGTLAYVAGSVAPPMAREPVWVDRQGREEPLGVEAKPYLSARVSPDGQQVLLSTVYPPYAIWLFDRERKTLRRQTFEGISVFAVWGPGAGHLTFDSDREGPDGLYWKPTDAEPGGVKRLASGSEMYQRPSSWSPDGKELAFTLRKPDALYNIWVLSLDGESKPFLHTRFDQLFPDFSPDGRWMLYRSDESGRPEVYVRPYPGPGRAMQISTSGGDAPGWSRDGSEVFYRWENEFLAVPIVFDGESLRPGKPVKLFDWRYHAAGPSRTWDVAPDGRFMVVKDPTAADLDLIRDQFNPDRIYVVLNWHEELKRKMAEAEQ